jgi:ABC-type nickel/cobalt efflux system permease component RcnA
MADRVEIARRAIYALAKPIGGAAVDALLKEFSGVPTEVYFSPSSFHAADWQIFLRMRLSSALEKILRKCSWWTSCMSLSLAFGKPCSRT